MLKKFRESEIYKIIHRAYVRSRFTSRMLLTVAVAHMMICRARKDSSIVRESARNSTARIPDTSSAAKVAKTNKRSADPDDVSLRTPAKKRVKTEAKTPTKSDAAGADTTTDMSPFTKFFTTSFQDVTKRGVEKLELERRGHELAEKKEAREAEAARRQAEEAEWSRGFAMTTSANEHVRRMGEELLEMLMKKKRSASTNTGE